MQMNEDIKKKTKQDCCPSMKQIPKNLDKLRDEAHKGLENIPEIK